MSFTRFFEVVLPPPEQAERPVVAGPTAEMLGRAADRGGHASGISRNTVIKATESEVSKGIEPTESPTTGRWWS